jgi:hypothetical protein
MSNGPLHNRSTFWYIVVTIFAGIVVGVAVLLIGRYVDSASREPKARVSEEPKVRVPGETKAESEGPKTGESKEAKAIATQEPGAQVPQELAPSASEVSQTVREDIWRSVNAWNSSIQSGDVDAYRGFYAAQLTRFYRQANAPIDEVVHAMMDEVQKYPSRKLDVSNPSFQLVGERVVQLDYDKTYRFSGSKFRLNQGKVKASLRFAPTDSGVWKITAEFDREICWSTLMRDPHMQSPPGTCP